LPLSRLIRGIVEFREDSLPRYAERFQGLADGQSPDALFITCADSRVVPNLLVSTDPGELFTMRNVGNLMPPATAHGLSTGDVSEASAVEYAVSVLKVANIVVCGHSACGAMKAVFGESSLDDAPNLSRWLGHARPALAALKREGTGDYDRLSQLNVLTQLDHLMTYPLVKNAVATGTLKLSGWWFEISSGDMYGYDPQDEVFTLIDRDSAPRFVRHVGG
jgi:carbonic anhydrase